MKVFVIGGVTGRDPAEEEPLASFCRRLGRHLGDSDHRIILCSCQPLTADLAVLEGLKESSRRATDGKLIVHRPDDEEIRKEWRVLREDIGLVNADFHDHKGPEFREKDGKGIISGEALRLAFLFCQIKALEECDVVLTVGGKTDGTAALLLAIA
jgi:hypothetical protein